MRTKPKKQQQKKAKKKGRKRNKGTKTNSATKTPQRRHKKHEKRSQNEENEEEKKSKKEKESDKAKRARPLPLIQAEESQRMKKYECECERKKSERTTLSNNSKRQRCEERKKESRNADSQVLASVKRPNNKLLALLSSLCYQIDGVSFLSFLCSVCRACWFVLSAVSYLFVFCFSSFTTSLNSALHAELTEMQKLGTYKSGFSFAWNLTSWCLSLCLQSALLPHHRELRSRPFKLEISLYWIFVQIIIWLVAFHIDCFFLGSLCPVVVLLFDFVAFCLVFLSVCLLVLHCTSGCLVLLLLSGCLWILLSGLV